MPSAIVIDEIGAVRDIVQDALASKGFAVRIFDRIDAGPNVEFSDADVFVIRLDMSPPGEEAIRAVRRVGFEAPILCIGVGIGPDRIERTKALGAQDYLDIPFGPWTLSDRVDRLLRSVAKK